jgi:hypothetical protein
MLPPASCPTAQIKEGNMKLAQRAKMGTRITIYQTTTAAGPVWHFVREQLRPDKTWVRTPRWIMSPTGFATYANAVDIARAELELSCEEVVPAPATAPRPAPAQSVPECGASSEPRTEFDGCPYRPTDPGPGNGAGPDAPNVC